MQNALKQDFPQARHKVFSQGTLAALHLENLLRSKSGQEGLLNETKDLPLAIIHSETSDSVSHCCVQLNCLQTSMARNLIILAHDMPGKGSVASVTRIKRPRAGSHQRMILLTALSSFPLSEPSLKELHTRRAPFGLSRNTHDGKFLLLQSDLYSEAFSCH